MTDNGLFGHFNNDNYVVCVFGLGLISGFIPYCGYIESLNHFSITIIMNCYLLEPFLGQKPVVLRISFLNN